MLLLELRSPFDATASLILTIAWVVDEMKGGERVLARERSREIERTNLSSRVLRPELEDRVGMTSALQSKTMRAEMKSGSLDDAEERSSSQFRARRDLGNRKSSPSPLL